MSIVLAAVGCNYSGESCQLEDCEIDAGIVAGWLANKLAFGREVIGKNATRKGFLKVYRALAAKKKPDDLAIISFSGHGTSDEINGKPVQGIVLNDLEIVYEFELRRMFADLGNVVFVADCCFSGGLLRGRTKQRWVPVSHCFRREVTVPLKMSGKPRFRFMACKTGETAASTGEGGALTLAMDEAFQVKQERTTFYEWGTRVKKLLPNEKYNQHPQTSYVDRTLANRALNSFLKKWNKRPTGVA